MYDVGKRGPKKAELSDEERAELDELRRAGEQAATALRQSAPTLEPLQTLAWLAGTHPTREVLTKAVQRCKERRYTWEQIAIAVGDSGDTQSIRRVMKRYGSPSTDT